VTLWKPWKAEGRHDEIIMRLCHWVLVSLTTANAFVIPSLLAKRPPMSSFSSHNAGRFNDEITIDGGDDDQQRRRKQSIESKPTATATKKKRRLGHLDNGSDSDDGFDVMRQKLKPTAAPITKQKKRLGHYHEDDSDSDDDFEVMRQKLREMQNSKVKEIEKRTIDNVDPTARAPIVSATVAAVASTKQFLPAKEKATTAPDSTDAIIATTSTTPTVAAVSTKQSSAKSKTKEKSQDVIELLGDSDSDDDNPVPQHERKRKARPSASSLEDEVKSMGIRAIKRELESYGISTTLFIEKQELVDALLQSRREGRMAITKKQDALIPFHLFATSSSKRLSQEKRKYFKTLREVIGLDVPNRQLKWLVISNFALDFGYLLEQTLPDILQFHRVVVFYSYCRNPDAMTKWREFLRGSGNTCEFIQLDPSAPANSRTNPLPIEIKFGMHHTKMFLTGYDEIVNGTTQAMIRVAVHTSNLLRGDNEMKANGAYTQNFPIKQSRASHNIHKQMKSDDTKSACLFEVDLAGYLESYGYTKRQRWCPPTSSDGESFDSSRALLSSREISLPELIRQYDYSSAYAVLIPSIPGRHKTDSYHNFGYLKLRKAIMDAFPAVVHQKAAKKKPPVLCQMSSLGYLNVKWLGKFHEAIDYQSTHSKNQSKIMTEFPKTGHRYKMNYKSFGRQLTRLETALKAITVEEAYVERQRMCLRVSCSQCIDIGRTLATTLYKLHAMFPTSKHFFSHHTMVAQ